MFSMILSVPICKNVKTVLRKIYVQRVFEFFQNISFIKKNVEQSQNESFA